MDSFRSKGKKPDRTVLCTHDMDDFRSAAFGPKARSLSRKLRGAQNSYPEEPVEQMHHISPYIGENTAKPGRKNRLGDAVPIARSARLRAKNS